ncbi:MAG: saccharopine dehydrogenase, partial [Caulobacteraceae bacterium]|nr:saccharopine dehydrogenase [Caulobacteraceae bacterium]
MKRIVVIGAGEIGSTIAGMLGAAGDYEVTVVDRSAEQLSALDALGPVRRLQADVGDPQDLQPILGGAFAVLSAAPYYLTQGIARAARAAGVHYLDLTEDVAAARVVRGLAADASTAFIPQCGLAPGFITIAAHDLISRFDSLQDVSMGV